jgi:hypothetical protein
MDLIELLKTGSKYVARFLLAFALQNRRFFRGMYLPINPH